MIETHALVLDDVALGLIASRWYPPEMIHAMIEGMFGSLDEETRHAQMREAATAAVRATGRGVYRFALERVVSPRLFAASIQVLWNMIHDSGVRSMSVSERAIESRTHGWLGHAPLLCSLMAETSAAVLETMGHTEVRWRRDECVANGDARCVIHYSWR